MSQHLTESTVASVGHLLCFPGSVPASKRRSGRTEQGQGRDQEGVPGRVKIFIFGGDGGMGWGGGHSAEPEIKGEKGKREIKSYNLLL